jgi:hypothetical protein
VPYAAIAVDVNIYPIHHIEGDDLALSRTNRQTLNGVEEIAIG